MATLAGLLWSGWLLRNYLVFNSFIPFTTQAGNAYYALRNDETASADSLERYKLWIDYPTG